MINICKWYNNADSPVIFMIDDLTNVWINLNNNGKNDPGEDWGYFRNTENSSFRFLKTKILDKHKKLKVTFYVPVGIRSGLIKNSKYKMISTMINENEDSIQFYRDIHSDPRFEIAYHGTTHGIAGENPSDYIQEWQTYKSIEHALSRINYGTKILTEGIGEIPKGGKYPGYASNDFSDQSIDESGFLWWNRFANYANNHIKKYSKHDSWISGIDFNQLSNFDIKTFGENNVIDIPTTLGGDKFTYLFKKDNRFLKGNVKKLLKPILIKKGIKEIDFLLKNKLVISILEHIAPSRNDGTRQPPNIFDDIKSLFIMFDYLKDKNVWYCTGTELAEYYYLRTQANIVDNGNTFRLQFNNDKNLNIVQRLSLKIDGCESLKLPDNEIITSKNNIFNIPILDGNYELIR